MKKILQFLNKHWKGFLALVGIGVVVEQVLTHTTPDTPHIPTIDVKAENAKVDSETKAQIQQIDSTTATVKKEISTQTSDQVMSSLSPEAQQSIQTIKDQATQEAVTNILGDLK